MTRTPGSVLWGALAGLVVILGIGSYFYWKFELPIQRDRARYQAVAVGQSQHEVEKSLGRPNFVVERGGIPPAHLSGFSHALRLINLRLLIYVSPTLKIAAFIYVGRDGRVEGVFLEAT